MSDPKLILIAAVSINGVIGNKDKIPWYIPSDFKHFKETTVDSPIIMGRKTFESIGNKPLKDRDNIVVTRSVPDPSSSIEAEHPQFSSLNYVDSVDKAIELAKSLTFTDIYVIGGQEIYNQTIDRADQLLISHVNDVVEGDTFFPDIARTKWTPMMRNNVWDGIIPYTIVTYDKVR